jgi:hypothetical protein
LARLAYISLSIYKELCSIRSLFILFINSFMLNNLLSNFPITVATESIMHLRMIKRAVGPESSTNTTASAHILLADSALVDLSCFIEGDESSWFVLVDKVAVLREVVGIRRFWEIEFGVFCGAEPDSSQQLALDNILSTRVAFELECDAQYLPKRMDHARGRFANRDPDPRLLQHAFLGISSSWGQTKAFLGTWSIRKRWSL